MVVIRSAETTAHELHGSRFTSYAAPATGSGELCVWRVDVAANTPGTTHTVSREEVLVLVAGNLRAVIDDDAQELATGDAVIVPAGSTFRLDNASEEVATAWVSTSVGFQATLQDGSRLVPPWVR
ncbi:MAG: cupin domain-containing protein [Nocardioidaceae bacterium]|jgi:mannose-6-phosphate isomerase-like protein (cupin superfamily)|nr:cupin domain-containing protein [Nocardioidaceae bacterium]